MQREVFDDCIEAVLSEHEKKVIGINQAPKFEVNTIDGKSFTGTIIDVTPNKVSIKTWKLQDGKWSMGGQPVAYIRRELIVSAQLSYITLPEGE